MSVRDQKFYNDSRVKDLKEEYKDNEEKMNDSVVMNAIKSLQKQMANPAITLANTGLKPYVKGHLPGGNPDGPANLNSSTDLRSLEELGTIGKVSDAISVSPMMKHLGELTGAISALQQVTQARARVKESNQIDANLGKSIYALQNGMSFDKIAAPAGAGLLKSGMASAGTVTAGSWLYDMMYNGGNISSLTNNSLALSNPGFLASHLFGGVQGLGSGVAGLAGKGLGLAGSLTGSNTLSKGAGALSSLDPTMAGIIGTASLIGISMGVNKLLTNVIKDSPLSSSKRNTRFNLSHQFTKATDNPAAMQSFMQSNNALKMMQAQNNIQNPLDALMVAKLNEIALYSSNLPEMFELMANKNTTTNNGSVRTLNEFDKTISKYDPTGKDQINLFNDGRLSSGQVAFLRSVEGVGNIIKSLSVSNIVTSLSGGNTSPNQGRLTEAIAGGDPDAAIKKFATNKKISLSIARLLNEDIIQMIGKSTGSYEDKSLMALLAIASLTQHIASYTGNGDKSMIGELAKYQKEQDEKMNANLTMMQKSGIELMRGLSKIPVLSAFVPALNGLTFASGVATKGISGLSKVIANPFKSAKNLMANVKEGYQNVKDRVIDSMRPEDVKNESTIRDNINAKALSLSEMADKAILQLPHLLQDIKWLLGSTDKAKVQDRYSGDYVTTDELAKRFQDKKDKFNLMLDQQNEEESYFDAATNWFKKKTFGIKDEDFKNSAMKNYSHVQNLMDELSPNMDSLEYKQTNDTSSKFNFSQSPIEESKDGEKGTPLYSKLNFFKNAFGKNKPQDSIENDLNNSGSSGYYDMMNEYIPMLKDIVDSTNLTATRINELKSRANFISKNDPTTTINKTKIKSKTISENITNQNETLNLERFQKLFYGTLPFLPKIYRFLTKDKIKSGMNSTSTAPVEVDGFLSNIFSGLFNEPDVDIDVDRNGKRKNKYSWKNFKNQTSRKIGAGVSSVMDLIKNPKAIAQGLLSISRTLAKPGPWAIGAAIAGIAGVGVDTLFNDGKYMRELWSSLKESSFGQTISGLWDSAKKYYDGFTSWFSNSFSSIGNSLNNTKEKLINGITGNGWNTNAQLPSQTPVFMSKQEIDSKINGYKSSYEKLSFIENNSQRIDPSLKQSLIESILKESEIKQNSKYGFSLSTTNIKDKFNEISNYDSKTKMELYKEFNENMANRKMAKLNSLDEDKEFKELNSKMQNMYLESVKDTRSQEQKLEEARIKEELLRVTKEASIQNNQAVESMKSIVDQSNTTNSAILKSFGEQFSALNQQQGNISNMLTMTAKLVQKPNTLVLDPTITKLFPALN